MAHLMFAGCFVFFVIVLIGGVYFRYVVAKRQKDGNTEILAETDKQDKWFYVQKQITLITGILVIVVLFILTYFFKLLKEKPQDAWPADSLWLLIDMLILAFFIFILLIIKCVRSYIHIHAEGFEYRQTFQTKTYSKEQIEYVYRGSDFIFIKQKDRRMPIIIEKIYSDNDCLYEMLCSLQNSSSLSDTDTNE